MRRAIQRREVISKKQTLTIACIWAFTALRMFFTFFFFVTSIICIVKSGSRIEKCKGQVSFSQKTIDALDTTSTFIETTFSSLLIFLLYSIAGNGFTSKISSRLCQNSEVLGRGPSCGFCVLSRTFSSILSRLLRMVTICWSCSAFH